MNAASPFGVYCSYAFTTRKRRRARDSLRDSRLTSQIADHHHHRDVILRPEPQRALHERVRELVGVHVRFFLRLLLDERRALRRVDGVPQTVARQHQPLVLRRSRAFEHRGVRDHRGRIQRGFLRQRFLGKILQQIEPSSFELVIAEGAGDGENAAHASAHAPTPRAHHAIQLLPPGFARAHRPVVARELDSLHRAAPRAHEQRARVAHVRAHHAVLAHERHRTRRPGPTLGLAQRRDVVD